MNGVGRGSEDKKDKNKTKIATRETFGMTFLLFGGLLLLITATGELLFGDVGKAITAFFLGTAGFYAYFLFAALIYLSIYLISGKKLLPKGWTLRTILLVTAVFLIVQAATAERFFIDPVSSSINSFGGYLSGCFHAAGEDTAMATGGGVLLGLIGYPVRLLFQSVGAYIVYAFLLIAALYFALIGTPLRAYLLPGAKKKGKKETQAPITFDDIPAPERSSSYAMDEEPYGVRSPAAPWTDPSAPAAPAAPWTEPYAPVSPAASWAEPSRTAPIFGEQPSDLPRSEAQARGRAILFSDDPAKNYRENLIFDEDSRFNSQPRRSSVLPDNGPYSEAYAAESGNRTSMPRRVTEDRPAAADSGYSYPLTDDNYPQKPSYRAPIGEAEGRDFYKNDVRPVEPFRPAEPARPAEPFRPAEPARPVEPFRPAEPARPVEPFRPAEPARPVEPFRSAEPTPAEDIFSRNRRDITPPTEPEAPTEDIFSRGRRDITPPTEPEAPADDIFSRGRRDITPPTEPEAPTEDIFSRGRRDITPPTEPEAPADDIFSRGRRDITPPTEPEAPADDIFGRGRRDITPLTEPEAPAEDIFGRGRRDITPPTEPEAPAEEPTSGRIFGEMQRSNANLFDDDGPLDEDTPEPPVPAAPQRKEVPKKKKHVWKKYRRPDVSLLSTYEDKPALSNEEVGRNSGIILDTLRRYKIETHVIGVKAGASVTRYDLAMPETGTISNVTRYDEELAVYLQVKGVNMYANPEVRGISVEVPNDKRSTVGLRSILESDEFKKESPEALLFALGQDVEGRCVCGNVTDMTHILVAGMTGSGKSIAMHSMLISMLFKYSPEELRLILIDPKQSEFTLYEGIPHLMINEIITTAPKAVAALRWAVDEMERRYTLFNEKTRSGVAVSKIDEYNQNLTEDEERLPKILVVVDEFSDLMMTAKKEVEEKIQRLAQKARAAGIHLVLATQRPDATVITGVIKSNLPTRISLSVDSDLNSRIMLDESGAEKLLGYGDMLVKTTGKPRRVQGSFISASERQRVITFIRENNETFFDESIAEAIDKPDGGGQSSGGGGGEDGVNETYIKALGVVVKRGQASISLIQRSLGIGYNHAGKIIEWMESQGFISAFEGSKARTVLLTKEEYESRFGGMD